MKHIPAALDRAGIAARVPHQGTMCLLDAMESCSADEIVCRITNHADAHHPLRLDGMLPGASALEYASQAMALHGSLAAQGRPERRTAAAKAFTPQEPPRGSFGAPGDGPQGQGGTVTSGFLVSARELRLHVPRLDTAGGPLRLRARRLAGDSGQAMYRFELRDAADRLLVEGRTTVVLDTPLVSPDTR
jgi:predicted hotdog family 3-hydroxylacyl-ACP dehydratase